MIFLLVCTLYIDTLIFSMTIPLKSKLEELENEGYRLSLRIKELEKELYDSRSGRRKPEDPNQMTFTQIDREQEQASAPIRSSSVRRKKRKG